VARFFGNAYGRKPRPLLATGFVQAPRVRIWNRVLGTDEVSGLYLSDAVPSNGLVGEFLLNADTGATATDTIRRNDGSISGAAWDIQR